MAVSSVKSGAASPEEVLAENPDLTESGPDDAWISEHYDRIHRAAWLMTGDPCAAEDLAQEVFVVAIDRWDRFGGRSSAATWLYGILIRLARRRTRSLMRFRHRLQQYVARHQPSPSSDPKFEHARQQWRDSIWRDVAKLPNHQRDAVLLRFAEGMSYEQIARAVGCAKGTAKTRVHHGLKKLRSRLPNRPIEPADKSAVSYSAATK